MSNMIKVRNSIPSRSKGSTKVIRVTQIFNNLKDYHEFKNNSKDKVSNQPQQRGK